MEIMKFYYQSVRSFIRMNPSSKKPLANDASRNKNKQWPRPPLFKHESYWLHVVIWLLWILDWDSSWRGLPSGPV